MRAIVLIGHGSLKRASGAAMLRVAARMREASAAPLVAAAFLNYSRPSFADVVARCVERGASSIIVVPYFLVPGKFVQVDVPRAVRAAHQTHPSVAFHTAAPLGDHPALARLVRERAAPTGAGGLVLVAHGSPDANANAPVFRIAEQVSAAGGYAAVDVAFLGLNDPDIPTAVAQQMAAGVDSVTLVPFMLQLGGHVADDLPEAAAHAQHQHPHTPVRLAPHLGYSPLLALAAAERASAI